jgi:hypothetical protein
MVYISLEVGITSGTPPSIIHGKMYTKKIKMGYSRTIRKGGLQKNVTHPPPPIPIQATVKENVAVKRCWRNSNN